MEQIVVILTVLALTLLFNVITLRLTPSEQLEPLLDTQVERFVHRNEPERRAGRQLNLRCRLCGSAFHLLSECPLRTRVLSVQTVHTPTEILTRSANGIAERHIALVRRQYE